MTKAIRPRTDQHAKEQKNGVPGNSGNTVPTRPTPIKTKASSHQSVLASMQRGSCL